MVNQRGVGHADIKSFDKVFAGLWLLLGMGSAVTAGLDAVRFGASRLPWSTFAVGLVILLPASALGGWAMVENEHFEQFVRVQEERGHRVVSTGPYAMVRHPGYLAAILGGFATPLMLGSLWTFVPVGILGVSFVVRTFFEDRTLQEELEGYSQYTRRTRYRLVPWLW